MENLFSDLEGLRIAMEIEQIGADFYQKAYEEADEAKLKEVFLLLKEEESRHFSVFGKLYDKIKNNKEYIGDEYLFDTECSRYLTVLAEGHIFPSRAKMLIKIGEMGSMEDVFDVAIQAEKDSILFFAELADKAKFEETRKIFTILKTEEQGHLIKLRSIFAELNK